MSSPCAGFAEHRSALVDGALADADRERLLRHLLDCQPCRADVAELRAVADLLRRRAVDADTEPELSSRLISIAGAESGQPLWSRPFDRPCGRRLPPSRRRTRRIRTLATTMVVSSLVLAALVAGWASAPASPALITDPVAGGTAEFSAGLAQLPLSSDAVSAVLTVAMPALVAPDAWAGHGALTVPAAPTHPHPLSAARSAAVLRHAVEVSGQISHSGTAQVSIGRGDRRLSAQVNVMAQAGQGAELTVRSSQGNLVREGFLPIESAGTNLSGAAAGELINRLVLAGSSGARVAGRRATMITAVAANGSERSWWIDDASGLLLWQQSRDAGGQVTTSAGFVTLVVGDQTFLAHLAPRLSDSATSASLTLGSAQALTSDGWFCAQALNGLDLVRLRTDSAVQPGVIHAVYSDGVNLVSVVQQHGRLASTVPGFTLARRTWWRGSGGMDVAAWQSGDTVFTVMTDGSEELLEQAVSQLPHQPVRTESRLDRVRAGWARIAHLVTG